MNRLFLILIFVYCGSVSLHSWAQDILLDKSGNEYYVKITEEGKRQISFYLISDSTKSEKIISKRDLKGWINDKEAHKKMSIMGCSQNLEDALKNYYMGKLRAVEALMGGCQLDGVGGLTKVQKLQTNRIIAISSIFLKNRESAEHAMLTLLKVNPEYLLTNADPPEFVKLYQSFRTDPIFSIGPKIGGYKIIIDPQRVSGTYNLESPFKPNYETELEFHFGASLDYKIYNSLTLNFELIWSSQKIVKWLNHSILLDLLDSRRELNLTEFTLSTEKQRWLQFPLSIQYRFINKSFNPYVSIGASLDYLRSAEIVGEESRRIVEVKNGLGRVTFASYNLNEQRNRILISPFAEIGVKWKLGKGYLTANFRFNYGVMDVGNDAVFYNTPSIWEINATNDIYRKHQKSINLGYIVNIYKPKMLSSKKTNR